ncbi:GntR family transcriptional regulator [Pigmentiphaga soli]|uniref:GntR family transcriptional regulator n=1 Tax=Pigmentiphaga soli TaxID=1007095 RepID=A0ABP8HHP0_9BURK
MNAPTPFPDDTLAPPDNPAEAAGGMVARLHARLHEMLLTHEIPLGTPLSERQLSLRLGVSRTPLREALRRLEGEGLIQRHNGVLEVRRITLEEFLELLKIRRLLEVEAAGAAAGHISDATLDDLRARLAALLHADTPDNHARVLLDIELHRAVCEACGNRSMAELIEQLRRKSMLFATPPAPRHFPQVVAEHLALLDALATGEPEPARATMAQHLDNVLDNILSRLLRR